MTKTAWVAVGAEMKETKVEVKTEQEEVAVADATGFPY